MEKFLLAGESTFANSWWIYVALIGLLIIMLALPIVPLVIKKIFYLKNKKTTYEKRESVNNIINPIASNFNKTFAFDDEFTYNDKNGGPKLYIYLSETDKRILLIDYQSGSPIALKYDEIKNIEIIENFSSKTSGGFGGYSNHNTFGYGNSYSNTSGFTSGTYSGTTNSICDVLSLLITTKNKNYPQIEYFFINNYHAQIKTNSQAYQHLKRQLTEFIAYFDIIKEE